MVRCFQQLINEMEGLITLFIKLIFTNEFFFLLIHLSIRSALLYSINFIKHFRILSYWSSHAKTIHTGKQLFLYVFKISPKFSNQFTVQKFYFQKTKDKRLLFSEIKNKIQYDFLQNWIILKIETHNWSDRVRMRGK